MYGKEAESELCSSIALRFLYISIAFVMISCFAVAVIKSVSQQCRAESLLSPLPKLGDEGTGIENIVLIFRIVIIFLFQHGDSGYPKQ